jgi:hypothetical protein
MQIFIRHTKASLSSFALLKDRLFLFRQIVKRVSKCPILTDYRPLLGTLGGFWKKSAMRDFANSNIRYNKQIKDEDKLVWASSPPGGNDFAVIGNLLRQEGLFQVPVRYFPEKAGALFDVHG